MPREEELSRQQGKPIRKHGLTEFEMCRNTVSPSLARAKHGSGVFEGGNYGLFAGFAVVCLKGGIMACLVALVCMKGGL